MLDVKRIYWLAGLVEGEGCFHTDNYSPLILQITSTDLDVLEKTKAIIGYGSITSYQPRKLNHKLRHNYKISGVVAVQWAFILYSLLCQRRRAKIRELISNWQQSPTLQRSKHDTRTCTKGHSLDLTQGHGVIESGCIRCLVCRKENNKRNYLRKRSIIRDNNGVARQDPVHGLFS